MDKDEIKNEEDVRRSLSGKTVFEKDVLIATYRIPRGKVSTYRRIAEKVGKPRAWRAVSNALHKNPLHPVVPCHRVIRSDGRFGGEKKGAKTRMKLVENEGVPIKNGKVTMHDDILF